MDFNFGVARERATQRVLMFNRYVPPQGVSIPLSEDLTADRLVTTFMVNNYSNAPDPVFLGVDSGMHSSIEIVPGACPSFTCWQEGRQMYELQILVMKMSGQNATDLIKIPVICWDMTTFYLESSSMQEIPVTVTAFPLPYL